MSQSYTGYRGLLDRSLVALILGTFFTMIGFYLLLSVVPLFTERSGGRSSEAGLATAAFMLSTVAVQVAMPGILRRFGYKPVLIAGQALLGLPALLYGLTGSVPSILAVTLFRGAGFGAAIVVAGALAVELAPSGRRGAVLGLFGVALTLPTIFGGALGLWIVENAGFGLAFLVGGTSPLLGMVAAAGLRRVIPTEDGSGSRSGGFFTAMRRGELSRIFFLFCSVTVASGVTITFLPLSAPASGVYSAAATLLVFGVAVTAGRLGAGWYCDRRGARELLVPGMAAAAVGMALLSSQGPLLLAGGFLFGGGFGMLQNATLMLVMARVTKAEYGTGSTLWNVAFDAGTGIGAFVFGFVVELTGFSSAFYLCAGLLIVVSVLVPLDVMRYRAARSS
jgi:predicted MFS family arabinose efflux permease